MLGLKVEELERLVFTVHACAALGNLETIVIIVLVAQLNHGSRYVYNQPNLFNKAVLCALRKVGKSRMAVKDEQVMAIQHIYTARTYLFAMNLTICIRAPHSL